MNIQRFIDLYRGRLVYGLCVASIKDIYRYSCANQLNIFCLFEGESTCKNILSPRVLSMVAALCLTDEDLKAGEQRNQNLIWIKIFYSFKKEKRLENWGANKSKSNLDRKIFHSILEQRNQSQNSIESKAA